MVKQICFIDGCDDVCHGLGMCKFHYQRYIHGTDLFQPRFKFKLHGLSKDKVYRRWASILNRCYSPNSKFYEYYGGRGIKVYEPWRTDAESFINYVKSLPKPSPRHNSIDRIDNDGDYVPGNLRWATPKRQLTNTRAQSRPKNVTGAAGVYLYKSGYFARININKKPVHLGTFKALEDAIKARKEAERKYYDNLT